MPKVGDRVIVDGTKIGNPRREGRLIGIVGPLINVQWSDGSTSLFRPGPGSVTFVPGNGAARSAPKGAARKPAGKAGTKAQPARGASAGKKASGTKKTPSSAKSKTSKRGR